MYATRFVILTVLFLISAINADVSEVVGKCFLVEHFPNMVLVFKILYPMIIFSATVKIIIKRYFFFVFGKSGLITQASENQIILIIK